jgi:hypothetical protein
MKNMDVVKERLMQDVLVLMFCCFITGFVLCLFICLNWQSNSINQASDAQTLHCFECEVAMPVKVNKGRMYCANCGLPH